MINCNDLEWKKKKMKKSPWWMAIGRGTINPMIPNMAFVGYVESASNLYTTEIRCKWLSRLVDGHFKLPSMETMFEQTCREMDIMRRTTRFYKRSCVSTFSINHSDEISEEMGCRSWRKKSWVADIFSPYSQDFEEEKEAVCCLWCLIPFIMEHKIVCSRNEVIKC